MALAALAESERRALAAPEIRQAYAALARFQLLTHEPRGDDIDLSQELEAALAALPADAIPSDLGDPLLSKLVERMGQQPVTRPSITAQMPAASSSSDASQDSEPEPGQ